ncbi:L-lactate dehydrogenase [Isoptericola sp. b441]|uniref:L-lactate dehydrogenase n=1 Tax=Actinotalea lenta TaxID=3064654 RepID=A0ABT9D932_9CELL|nr:MULTISPECIES: L-lactate dehydrogenase [unclassified Isoptericola]MDO8107401.1 L-lactate dehydrogenase [Isoptericola sp. b441]MDO8120936.1 L-lactate dehydrogenase [Isoptericola sp. b490]
MSEETRPGVDRRTTKLAVVGAGSVGATVAYAALMRGVARTVALYDINAAKVEAEVLDLGHGIQFMPMAQVIGSDDLAVCADADVVVVTAGAKQKPGQTRLDLAEATIGLVNSLMPKLVEVAPDAVYIMVTNPVDIVTHAAIRASGLPDGQLFGSGTVLDSSRLRWLIAHHCNVAVQNVHAYIAGEHGDSEIPLWSSASVGSVPLLEWRGTKTGNGPFDEATRRRIAEDVVGSAYKIIEGKGATNYAVAQAATRIIEAVLKDEKRVLPVSSMLQDYYGIGDVCLSVPSVVGRRGVEARLEVPMSDQELAGLQDSARSLHAVAERFGL